MSNPVIGYAGMTHLGLVSAAAAAARGFHTIAFDPDATVIAALHRNELPVVEPGLAELMAGTKQHLVFTAEVAAVSQCDLVYISVDVPTDDQARSDLDPIRRMVERVLSFLGPKGLLIVLSQVPPGFTRTLPFPADRLYSQVETLIFGHAVERATQPERFIVGCAYPGQALPAALSTFLTAFSCPILPMSYESAELAKISINFCLVASVSVANMLAELCEAIGADWTEITPALKLDRRIGPHSYLRPGLGIGGGNLERDLRSILTIADALGTDAGMVRAWLANSEHRKAWTWRTIRDTVLNRNPNARIAVLGLAYKENTHSTKNSPSLVLLEHLKGKAVTVHDPVVPPTAVSWATAADDPIAAATGADVLVIATPWPQYHDLKPEELARAMAGRTILDPHRILDGRACAAAGFAYHTLGAAPIAPTPRLERPLK